MEKSRLPKQNRERNKRRRTRTGGELAERTGSVCYGKEVNSWNEASRTPRKCTSDSSHGGDREVEGAEESGWRVGLRHTKPGKQKRRNEAMGNG